LQDVAGESWTYAQLEARVLAWAAVLHGRGVAAGDRVVVMLPNSFDGVAVWLASARLGAIEVPANTAYRGRFLEHLVTNSGARVAVVADAYVERFGEIAHELDLLGSVPAAPPTTGGPPSLVEPGANDVATI